MAHAAEKPHWPGRWARWTSPAIDQVREESWPDVRDEELHGCAVDPRLGPAPVCRDRDLRRGSRPQAGSLRCGGIGQAMVGCGESSIHGCKVSRYPDRSGIGTDSEPRWEREEVIQRTVAGWMEEGPVTAADPLRAWPDGAGCRQGDVATRSAGPRPSRAVFNAGVTHPRMGCGMVSSAPVGQNLPPHGRSVTQGDWSCHRC